MKRWRWVALGIISAGMLAVGCSESRNSPAAIQASREFARAQKVRFTDLRPGKHEEIVLRKKSVLTVLTQSVAGAEMVPEARGKVVGRIELLNGQRVLAEYRYHVGGTLEGTSGSARIIFRPRPTFYPALFVNTERDWISGSEK